MATIVRTASTWMSEPVGGRIYIAEPRPRCRRLRLRWSAMPEAPTDVDSLIDARRVPLAVRHAAMKHFTAVG